MTNEFVAGPTNAVSINILIVVDGRLSFEEEVVANIQKYSASFLVKALAEWNSPLLRVSVTTAYRTARIAGAGDSNGIGADFLDFRFENDQVVEPYDQAWLLGDHFKVCTTELSDSEIEVVNRFMNIGKRGVFATGDHTSLGAAINGRLPRVGTMRTWDSEWPPFASDSAARHDTTRVGTSGPLIGSDGVPQIINVTKYKALNSSVYPHPLLCGSRGDINVLPDHVHEGNCPHLELGTLLETEYPALCGVRIPPLVIAQASSFPLGRPTGTFGAIGAYDGHPVNIGRVVVDSSFHHFLNQNLTGFVSSADATPYEAFKAYFRNIALWLAPPEKQREVFKRALILAFRSVSESPPTPDAIKSAIENPSQNSAFILGLGRKARTFVAETTTRCFALLWSVEALKMVTNNVAQFRLYYPWFPENGLAADFPVEYDQPANEDPLDFLIGGVMVKLFSLSPPQLLSDQILVDGAELGLRAYRGTGQ